MMGMVTQICPKTYSGSSATRQNHTRRRSRSTSAVPVQRADERVRVPGARPRLREPRQDQHQERGDDDAAGEEGEAKAGVGGEQRRREERAER